MGIILIIIAVIGIVVQNVKVGGIHKNMSTKNYLIIAFWLVLFCLGVINL